MYNILGKSPNDFYKFNEFSRAPLSSYQKGPEKRKMPNFDACPKSIKIQINILLKTKERNIFKAT